MSKEHSCIDLFIRKAALLLCRVFNKNKWTLDNESLITKIKVFSVSQQWTHLEICPHFYFFYKLIPVILMLPEKEPTKGEMVSSLYVLRGNSNTTHKIEASKESSAKIFKAEATTNNTK